MNVTVPTINDSLHDFDALFRLWQAVNGDGLNVTFEFHGCTFLRQNAVAFLGGLKRLIEYRGGTAAFDWTTLRSDVALNLAKSNFRDTFGDPTPIGLGHTIPYREDLSADKETLLNYLKAHWLGRGWVNVSARVRDAIVGQVWEIYANAFEHAGSHVGLFSCGQHYPRLDLLKLTVVDFGVGIPSNVRRFFRRPGIPSAGALQWAFRPGTTTKPNGMGRGVGLDLLKHFIRVNKGSLEVFSHDSYALIDEKHERFEARGLGFEGTLVNISLRCDESYYCFASEVSDKPIF